MSRTVRSLALAAGIALALAPASAATTFSVSGAGGQIPGFAGGTWNVAYNSPSFTSRVVVPRAVTSITAVTLTGFTHTWRGNLHVILRDPSGQGHSIVTRPGFTGIGFGDSGNYLLGTYAFVETGGASVAQGPANIAGGTYDQHVNAGSGMWSAAGIDNLPLGSISGAAGTWTLEIRDWASGDVGSLTGWTLSGTDASASGTTFCEGTRGCPCGNDGAAGNGCANAANSSGANLSSAASTLTVTGINPGAAVIFVKGTPSAAIALFDGLLCMQSFLRFGLTTSDGGGSASTVDLGPGSYQAWYRDVPTSACGNLANTTNGVSY